MSKRNELIASVLAAIMQKVSLTNDEVDDIRIILTKIVSDYEVEVRNTELIPASSFVPDYYGLFIAWKKIAGRTVETLKLYNYYLMDFFLNKPAPLEEMDSSLMIRYLYDYQKRKGVGNRTLDSVRIVINTFLQWAANEGYIEKNFCGNIDPIKYTAKPRKPLSDEEVEIFREACETYRERAIVDTFLSTGVRIAELARLNWSDIDMDKREIVVFGKGGKYRTVCFDSRTKVSLMRYRAVCPIPSTYVFQSEKYPYGQLAKEAISGIIQRIDRRAKMDAHVTAHVLRHTFATHALARGMSIDKLKTLLGHENYDTTLIYADIDMSQVQYEYRQCFGS